ncbi:MAG: class I SAM-dependent methyltransferase [Chlorobia bacterium]|nr:class I SAM-dependent methyltransferase [Fimbriimonadaceae bacterium]
MQDWIKKLFVDPGMVGMGHDQSQNDLNLGLGWIYYGLARTIRPKTVVVIGSYRGFVPLVLGKALQDNGQGEVIFIDPSMVDDFWKCPDCVKAHFAAHEVRNIRHHLCTTQDFVNTEAYRSLGEVGLLYVDGYHTAEFAKFDHEAFADKMAPNGVVLFHDSVRERVTRIYGDDRPYTHTVCQYMDELRANPKFEVLSFGEGDGLTLVKKASGPGAA